MTLYSPFFLLGFLPIAAAVYFAVPRAARSAVMAGLSLVFYFFAAGKFFYVLPLLAVLTYVLSFAHARIGFFAMLLLLPILRIFGITAVGVSFFILRAAAYLYETYREKNFFRVFAFLMFFPTVTVGPVTRYFELETPDYTRIANGICLAAFGLCKKLFFADALYAAFERFLGGITSLSALCALICFALYIYFDFSGYSDIAIGIAAMFGAEIPKNFDYPYLSHSVGEFFRRWHISLGTFLRDYVYIPLGGSRKGRARTLLSLGAVWFFSALWHGMELRYLLWGGYFFCLIAAEKLFDFHFGRLPTLLLVLLGWIPFFSETPFAFFSRLFCLGNTLLYSRVDLYHGMRLLPFLLLAMLFATPLPARLFSRVRYPLAFAVAVLVLSCLALGAHQPFLYAAF